MDSMPYLRADSVAMIFDVTGKVFREGEVEIRIVSGGQTGVDQGALEAAIDLRLAWGGWVPKGWKTEAGALSAHFRRHMQEHASEEYLPRTRQNVIDSHATLIVVDKLPLNGGTLKTKRIAEQVRRSHFVVICTEKDAVCKAQKWLRQFFEGEHPIPFVLNVAGPRETKSPGIQARTRRFVTEFIRTM